MNFNFNFDMGDITNWLLIVLTAAIVILTWLNYWVVRRLKWLTGAMERHSDQQRQLAARDAGIKMLWWDKTIGGPFPHEGEHKQPVELDTMYIGIPETNRRYRGWRGGIRKWWRQYITFLRRV